MECLAPLTCLAQFEIAICSRRIRFFTTLTGLINRKKEELLVKEQEERRKKREEKRRRKRKEKREQEEAERLARRIAMEERKLLLAQRKLESIRLISELIDRVKVR